MSQSISWARPLCSRTAVDKAGRLLAAGTGASNPLSSAPVSAVIDNWRSSHSFPLNTLQMGLRQKAAGIDRHAVVAQRLKRVPSIIHKLRRYPKMQLSRMQDIGGARAVVPTIAHVDALRRLYSRSRARHELANERDYIRNPKESGYRCVHLVYRYKSNQYDMYNGLQIELQIRTRMQHAWATAVETVGTFLGESLKSSQGPEPWLRFFELIGSGFALREGGPQAENVPDDPNDLIEEIRAAAQDLEVMDTLTKFQKTLKIVKRAVRLNLKYVLLVLEPKQPGLRILGFRELHPATTMYLQEEQRLANTSGDVVLAASDSLASLQRAFPNYFADSSRFLKEMDRLLA